MFRFILPFFVFVLGLGVFFAGDVEAAGQETQQTLFVAGEERSYVQYLPENFQPSRQYPVLFLFHGHNGTANNVMNYTGIRELADAEDIIVVAPESGYPASHDFVVNIPFGGPVVAVKDYDLTGKKWAMPPMQTDLSLRCTSEDRDFVEVVLNQLRQEYQVIDSHVFAWGHSQGAVYAYWLTMCSSEFTGLMSQSGGLIDILNDRQVREVVPAELASLMDLVQTFPDDVFEAIMGVPREEAFYPIPVLTDREAPAAILHAVSDNVVDYERSVLLKQQLEEAGVPVQFTTTPDALGHGWDPDNNAAQWQFLIENVLPLPAPMPLWQPQLFTVLGGFNTLIWEHRDEPLWTVLFDYMSGEVQEVMRVDLGPFAGFRPLDNEISWHGPNYFSWTLWEYEDGRAGLWRQTPEGNKQRFEIFAPEEGKRVIDLALDKNGLPVVLQQYSDESIAIEFRRNNGKLRQIVTFDTPFGEDENWEAKELIGTQNGVAVVWQSERGRIEIWDIQGEEEVRSFTYDAPVGYKTLLDVEYGWVGEDTQYRVLWASNNGEGIVWVIDEETGGVLHMHDVGMSDYVVQTMETDMFGQIRLLFVNNYRDIGTVLEIRADSGEILGSESYQVE